VKKFATLILLLAICSSLTAAPARLTIFAAASLKEVVDDLSEEFGQNHKADVSINFASSGQLAQQIKSGAPADIFLSADLKWIDYLIENDIVRASETFTLCENRIVIIGAADFPLNEIDVNDKNLKIGELFDGRLAIGDPMHVPGGKYAVEFLKSAGWYESLKDRILPCVSIRSALMMIELQEWQVGIVFYSDYKASEKVKLLAEIPSSLHSKITYGGALISNKKVAHDFGKFLQTGKAKKILVKHSFFPVTAQETGDR
jgi:molybdate transport system substrate-binding protein